MLSAFVSQLEAHEVLVRISYVELYNEEFRDLLNPSSSADGGGAAARLVIRDDPKLGPCHVLF
jgi:hypothetical protein